MKSGNGTGAITTTLGAGAASDVLIVGLKGILSNERFFFPLAETFDHHGNYLDVTYTGDGFNHADVIKELSWLLMHSHELYRRIILVGVSLGGLIAVDMLSKLQEINDKLRLIIVDAPAGLGTLGGPNAAMIRVNQLGALATRLAPHGRWVEKPGKPLLNAMLVPPKKENIEPFDASVDYRYLELQGKLPTNQDELAELVTAFSMQNMRERSFREWSQQMAYISRFAMKQKTLRGVPTVYIASVGPANDTVIQPKAAKAWQALGANLQEIEGAHAAIAERPTAYRALFHSVLASFSQ